MLTDSLKNSYVNNSVWHLKGRKG